MDTLNYIMLPLREPMLLLLTAVGTFAGVYIGAIPGLSATMAVSLLVSFTFGWETNQALALMIGVFVGGVFGGSRSAILLNIPGAPASIATCMDGYPLAKKGMAGKAMGIATTQSFIGTLLGVAALVFLSPLVSRLALRFSSIDYLMLAVMGMMTVGSLGSNSVAKGLAAAAMGVLLGTVGMDTLTAMPRFTFSVTYLITGVDYVVAMIGLFGVSQALCMLGDLDVIAEKQKVDKILPSFKTTLKYLPLTLRSAVIGVVVGALPGAGGDIAALLCYDHAKRTVKHPEVPFGEGAIEGIVAPETANNAAIGGAFIPMLTLGIPGDAVTAILLGALAVHGLRPGPALLRESPELFYLIVGCLLYASVFLLIFGLSGIKLFSKIVEIPKGILIPMVIVLSVVGAYAINNNLVDILWMLAFGILGYFLKKYDYPIGPVVLGIILCPMLEENFRRGVLINGSIPAMLGAVFNSSISITLLGILILLGVTRHHFKN